MRTVLRVFYWVFAILVIAGASVAWWFIYRPLPQIDGSVLLPGLRQEVTVERDGWGVPHIRATTVEDLAEAQGYVMAQDRLWQMDLLRRAARGQLSEILGARTVKIDESFRTYGFARAAEREATLFDPESRKVMDAYARGVNQFIEQHKKNLPLEFSLLHYEPTPWQPSDTLAISGYMYRTLTDTWERELNRAKVTERAGAERAKDLFSEEAAMDHFVVGDPKVIDDGSQRSAAHADDEDDDDDMEPDAVLKASRGASGGRLTVESDADLTSALAESVQEFLQESKNEIRQGLGSNNWVVSGAHTATGKPLLANDTHLELSIPPIWYEMHLTAPGWNVKGFTLPGTPMIIIGHNERRRRTSRCHCDASWPYRSSRGRKRIRAAMDCNGAWRACQQLQLAGQGAQLERIPRSHEARVGTGAERGVRGRRRQYRIRDGRARANSQEGAR